MGPRTDGVILPRADLDPEQMKELARQVLAFLHRLQLEGLLAVIDHTGLSALFEGEFPLPWPMRDALGAGRLSYASCEAIECHGGLQNLPKEELDGIAFEEPLVPERYRQAVQLLSQASIQESFPEPGSLWVDRQFLAHVERSAIGRPIAFSVRSRNGSSVIDRVVHHLRIAVSGTLVEDILVEGQSWRRLKRRRSRKKRS